MIQLCLTKRLFIYRKTDKNFCFSIESESLPDVNTLPNENPRTIIIPYLPVRLRVMYLNIPSSSRCVHSSMATQLPA